MILVDSSVWIDYFRNRDTPEAVRPDRLLGAVPLAIFDLILAEILQGIDRDQDFERVRRLLSTLELIVLGREEVAVQAAQNFRKLRERGITIRKTIDTVIATRCIRGGRAALQLP